MTFCSIKSFKTSRNIKKLQISAFKKKKKNSQKAVGDTTREVCALKGTQTQCILQLTLNELHYCLQERDGDGQETGPRGMKRKAKNRDAARKSRKKQMERADELHEVGNIHSLSSFSPVLPFFL